MNVRALDPEVSERIMGWRFWIETRGDYSLAVYARPGESEPWKSGRNGTDERYQSVTAARAYTTGFFGTRPPSWTSDAGAAFEVVARMHERGWLFQLYHGQGSTPTLPLWGATFTRGRSSDCRESATFSGAICLAALAALDSEVP